MPTQTAPPPSQQQAPNPTAVLAALTVLLLSGAPAAVILPPAIALLAPLGIGAQAVTEVLELLIPNTTRTRDFAPNANSASGHILRTSSPRQAAYLLNASRRLTEGGSLDQERQYLSQHLNAERGRQEAAQRVDAAARMFGPVLGWRAVMDSHTTPACAQANGNNFHFATPPRVGYPGSLHGSSCRCLSGPAWPDGRWVDEVVTAPT